MNEDVIKLCKSILENSELRFSGDSNGPDYYECPYCEEGDRIIYKWGSMVSEHDINTLIHDENCPFALAKELVKNHFPEELI